MRVAVWTLALLGACSSTPSPPLTSFRPSEVTELTALPPGFSAGATLRERCSSVRRAAAVEAETLSSVDCNEARLSRVLRARAGELSARFIVGKTCRVRSAERRQVECWAKLAVAGPTVGLVSQSSSGDPGPAPTPSEVEDLDEPRPQDAQQIQVTYTPTPLGARAGYLARRYDAVAETHWPSVGRARLGRVSASCVDCGALQLRHALRVAAGHAGAGEVTEVTCFQDADAQRCVAAALAPWSS